MQGGSVDSKRRVWARNTAQSIWLKWIKQVTDSHREQKSHSVVEIFLSINPSNISKLSQVVSKSLLLDLLKKIKLPAIIWPGSLRQILGDIVKADHTHTDVWQKGQSIESPAGRVLSLQPIDIQQVFCFCIVVVVFLSIHRQNFDDKERRKYVAY